MTEQKYLWINDGPQYNQTIFIYQSKEGKVISGNIVSDSNTISPYSKESIYKNATCIGEVDIFIKKIEPNHYDNYEYIGLTDINHIELEQLSEVWKEID